MTPAEHAPPSIIRIDDGATSWLVDGPQLVDHLRTAGWDLGIHAHTLRWHAREPSSDGIPDRGAARFEALERLKRAVDSVALPAEVDPGSIPEFAFWDDLDYWILDDGIMPSV